MTVLVVIGAVVVATACVNVLLARRAEDTEIVRHERALAALRELSDHPHPLPPVHQPPIPSTAHVRILHEVPADMLAQRRRARRSAHAARAGTARRRTRSTTARPAAARPRLVVSIPAPELEEDDDVAAALVVDEVAGHAPEPSVSENRHARHLHVAPRSRALIAGSVAAAVVIAVGVAVYPPGRDAGAKRAGRPPRASTSPAAAGASATTTTASAPAITPAPVELAATGNGTVTVSAPFTLMLSANGPCWVRVQDNAAHTLYEGTLTAGEHRQVSAVGPLTVRLGNTPAIQLAVNGSPVNIAKLAKTANVQFVPPV